ncbi:MAG: hypothetical protein V2A58_12210 [Planctomycetota bacterium]
MASSVRWIPFFSCVLALGCASHAPGKSGAAVSAGKLRHPSTRTFVSSTLRETDRIFFVQGTTGKIDLGERGLRSALRSSGCEAEVVCLNWHGAYNRPFLYVVTNRAEYEIVVLGGQKLADEIVAKRQSSPPTRFFLVGYSAGAEVIRQALELLPPDLKVDNVVFLMPACAPDAPFARALDNVDGRIYSIYSPLEPISASGALMGGSDRRYAATAGLLGLHPPEGIDEPGRRLYESKVVNVPWQPRFALWGFAGDHFSGWSPAFVRNVILPMLEGHYRIEQPVEARPIE